VAGIAILVGSIGLVGADLNVSGVAIVEGHSPDFGWAVIVPWTTRPAQVNNAIVAAVIAAAANLGITIVPSDSVSIFGGASAG
jgi:hypothetical protein